MLKIYFMRNFDMLSKLVMHSQVRLPSMDGRVALVPWADMLNHNCEVVNSTFVKMFELDIYGIILSLILSAVLIVQGGNFS